MNLKLLVLGVAGTLLVAIIPIAVIGQRKAAEAAARTRLEHELHHVRSAVSNQQETIERLQRELQAVDEANRRANAEARRGHAAGNAGHQQAEHLPVKGAARHAEEAHRQEEQRQQQQQAHEVTEAEKLQHMREAKAAWPPVAPENCRDKHERCGQWVDCCPGHHDLLKRCSKADCPAEGKPCIGKWMGNECPIACGLCEETAAPNEPVVLKAIWDEEGKDEGALEEYPEVRWKKWHEKAPRILAAENVLTKEEAESIIEQARPKLKRSQVVHYGNASNGVDNVRTSSGMWMPSTAPEVKKLRNVVSRLVNLPVSHFEELQVLRYLKGERYIHHKDFFDKHMVKYMGKAGNRVATCIVFLNDIPPGEGGDTRFVFARPEPVGFTPKRGTGVVFYSLKKNGELDYSSEHEAIPPKEGQEKWVAITWIRERSMF